MLRFFFFRKSFSVCTAVQMAMGPCFVCVLFLLSVWCCTACLVPIGCLVIESEFVNGYRMES
jgi:hypothetical protein